MSAPQFNETRINAMLAALTAQRDSASNISASLSGELAVANARIKELTDQLDAATALIAANAEVVPKAEKKGKTNA